MGSQAEVKTLTRETFDRLIETAGLTLFRYKSNVRGFIFLRVCAAMLLLIASGVYMATEFDPSYWVLISVVLSGGAFWLLGIVVYWNRFARRSMLAFNDDLLFIVQPSVTYQIGWEHITAESVGFAEHTEEQNPGILEMQLGGQEVVLLLFNPYVWVDDFPVFLAEILNQIKENRDIEVGLDPKDDEAEALEAEPASVALEEATEAESVHTAEGPSA